MHVDDDAVPPDDRETAVGDALARRLEPHRAGIDLGPLSPELALVDPELAAAARARLPEVRPIATTALPAPRPATTIGASPRVPPVRRRRVLWKAAVVAGAGAAVLASVALLEHGDPRADAERPVAVLAAEPPAVVERPASTAAPPSPATAPDGETFVWAAAADAVAYEFQLFRGGRRIYRARVTEPRLELPAEWRLDGRSHSLTRGTYRWYVWPVPRGAQRQAPVAIVQAQLVVN